MSLHRQNWSLLSRINRRSFLRSLFAAGLVATPAAMRADPVDQVASLSRIMEIFNSYFFDPTWMSTSQAHLIFSELLAIAKKAPDPTDFCRRFEANFKKIGLSHVALSVQRSSATELGQYFDSLEVGPGAVDLVWHGSVACLSIRTFMGQDTGPRISSAFEAISCKGASNLIVDLRDNPGGAFAMRNLVGHCLTQDVDAGLLLSREWFASNARMEGGVQPERLSPWLGESVVDLWNHLETHPLTRVLFSPRRPTYHGPITILINARTESAAELVAEVLRSRRGARLVGERSAGAMLVQRPFDVFDRFTLSLPVADYVSHASGRIEGSGLEPDVRVRQADARSVSLATLSEDSTGPSSDVTAGHSCSTVRPGQ